LLALLASKEVLPQGNDVIVWPLNPKGSFSVKSFCSTLVEATSCWDGAAKAIWNSKVPTKAFFFFAWVASKGKIPTEDKLKEEILMVLVDALCVWRR